MDQGIRPWMRSRTLGLLASGVIVAPILAGCGNSQPSGANLPPLDQSARPQVMNQPYSQPQQPSRGLSTGQKVAILAGAAALYYMYRKNKQRQQAGQANGQPVYYLSKNGRVYYRDSTGRAVWVTPPPGGIRVPASEAMAYQDFQGYNNRSTGRDLRDVYQSGGDPMPSGSYGGGY